MTRHSRNLARLNRDDSRRPTTMQEMQQLNARPNDADAPSPVHAWDSVALLVTRCSHTSGCRSLKRATTVPRQAQSHFAVCAGGVQAWWSIASWRYNGATFMEAISSSARDAMSRPQQRDDAQVHRRMPPLRRVMQTDGGL